MEIDIRFDVRTDSGGNDPDSASNTLRQYHQRLWSKPLPKGELFQLQYVSGIYHYLIFESKNGTMFLSSDSITTSMSAHKRLKPVLSEIPEEQIERFRYLGSTIGARTLFPGRKVDGLQTINQARGFSSQIKDRFDLTLECIRLFYRGESSPFSDVLERYSDFFGLFADFQGYVDFFLLQDLVDGSSVRFFLPFDSFEDTGPYPNNVDEYIAYMNNSIEFVKSRNDRIAQWATNENR
jgi:hypothetical protein